MNFMVEVQWETLLMGFLQIIVVLVVAYLGKRRIREIDIKINGNLEKVRKEAEILGEVVGHSKGVEEERQREENL